MRSMHAMPSRSVAGLLFGALTFAGTPAHRPSGDPASVSAKLSEWKVELSQGTLTAGIVTFTVTNAGSIPHAFEVEGQGIEQETDVIQPGSSATLKLTLKPGTYDVYCPVGADSHKHLGMETHLRVVSAQGTGAAGYSGGAASGLPDHQMSQPSLSIQ
ncbi:MAG TPA: cupredoxin domain-containing protein, partial [Burkholderiaceae bacterium]|nr:cupredoxin domain-containing protein [Burkholderiaceae bacterium]